MQAGIQVVLFERHGGPAQTHCLLASWICGRQMIVMLLWLLFCRINTSALYLFLASREHGRGHGCRVERCMVYYFATSLGYFT